ncbi:hypothetical protein V6N13_121960 [Hibiscus sabdariffa]|uniref:Uncharacterized protein n=2 Tax=Hibiscus sabdariffa TaxID=183260 RepID=A0ABR2C765_9ROSI
MASTREQPASLTRGRIISPPPGFGGQRATATKGRRISPPPGFGDPQASSSRRRRLSHPPGFGNQRASSRGRRVSPPPGFGEHRGSTNRARNVSPPPRFGQQLSPLTVATLQRIRERENQGKDRKKAGGSVHYFDNTEPRYSWLLPGWVAEERIVPSGRLYKYYYDPSAHLYRTKYEVLYAWETMGIVCLDP